MKITLSILFFLLTFQLSFAQSVSKSRTTTTTDNNTTQEIHVDIDSKQKMKLRIDKDEFEMKIHFLKKYDSEIENLVSKHFRYSEGTNERIPDIQFSIKSGQLETYADLNDFSDKDIKRLSDFTKELFAILDWDVEIMDL